MKALLKFCCFSPPQTLEPQGSLHFTRLEGNKNVGNNKVLAPSMFDHCTRRIPVSLVELGAARRLPSPDRVKRRHGGAGNANARMFQLTGGCLCLPAQQANLVLCCPNLQLYGVYLFVCSLLGQNAKPSNQQHVQVAANGHNVNSALLQNQLPASTAQVTLPQTSCLPAHLDYHSRTPTP